MRFFSLDFPERLNVHKLDGELDGGLRHSLAPAKTLLESCTSHLRERRTCAGSVLGPSNNKRNDRLLGQLYSSPLIVESKAVPALQISKAFRDKREIAPVYRLVLRFISSPEVARAL